MNVNTEDFISEVEKHPSTWNVEYEGYSNKLEKMKAWEAVISKFAPDFGGGSAPEKKTIASSYQRKWKSLRDSYTRELARKKKEQSGSAASGRKQYIFFENLRFLETSVKATCDSIEGDTDEDSQHDESQVEGTEEHVGPTHNKKKKRAKAPTETDELIETLKAKFYKRGTSNEQKDEDTLFMLSLVPELKKLPELVKLDTKAEILNVLRKARTQSVTVACSSTSCSPHCSVPYLQPEGYYMQHHMQLGNFPSFPHTNSVALNTTQTDMHTGSQQHYRLTSNASASSMSSEINLE